MVCILEAAMIKKKTRGPVCGGALSPPGWGTERLSPARRSAARVKQEFSEDPGGSRTTGPGRAGDKRIFNLLIHIL